MKRCKVALIGSHGMGKTARWPSYSGWAEFCRAYELGELFKELFASHPGHCDLTAEHLAQFKRAAKKRIEGDYNRERMKWLLYWSEWALANCKRPGITNS